MNGRFQEPRPSAMGRLPSADHEDSVTAFGLEQPVRPATAEAERQIQLNLSFRFFQPLTATDP